MRDECRIIQKLAVNVMGWNCHGSNDMWWDAELGIARYGDKVKARRESSNIHTHRNYWNPLKRWQDTSMVLAKLNEMALKIDKHCPHLMMVGPTPDDRDTWTIGVRVFSSDWQHALRWHIYVTAETLEAAICELALAVANG